MSASREKKARMGDTSLNEKELQAQQKAAAAKRKRTVYTVIGVIAAIAIVALLVWDSGMFQKNATAMTVNGRDYTPGEVSYYYGSSRDQYSYYLQYMGYDPTLSDKEQYFDEASGRTYYDLFMDSAKALMVQTAALADAAKADGVALSEDSLATVDSAIAEYESMASQYGYTMEGFLTANFGRFMNEKILRECLKESALANQYYADYAETLTYDDAALKAYYEENAALLDTFVYDVCYLSGTPASSDATEEEKKAAMDEAKADADKLSAASGKEFAVQANLLVSKNSNSTFTEEITNLGSSVAATYYDWLTDGARKEGDVTAIESEGYGYYVVRFLDRYLDEESFSTAGIRHILIKADVAEGATEPTAAAMSAAKEQAQALLDEFAVGAQTGEAFGELAKKYSDDPGSKDNGGLYEGVTRSTSFFADFLNWIFQSGRQVGDTGLVVNTQAGQQGWHVMYLDSAEGAYWKEIAANALLSEDLAAWSEGLQSGYEAVEGAGIKHVG